MKKPLWRVEGVLPLRGVRVIAVLSSVVVGVVASGAGASMVVRGAVWTAV